MSIVTSSAVETVRNAFNFTVDKFPLSGPDGMSTPHYGLFRSDNAECVGRAVSGKYVPHTTDDVVALTEAASHAFEDSIRVTTHWKKGHHVLIEPTREHRMAVFGTRDNIFPRFMIDFGYDGNAAQASLGMYRDACRNMHILRQTEGTSVSIMHTQSLRGRMDDLIDVFRGLQEGWNSVKTVVAEMENRKVSLANFLDAVYPKVEDNGKRGETIHKNRTAEIMRRVMAERYSTGRPAIGPDFMVSGWEAFNAVQGFVQHEKRSGRSKLNDFDRILLAIDDPAVRKAEKLALGMQVA